VTVGRSRQTALFVAGMLAVVLLQSTVQLDLRGQILVLAPAVALLGLPHGALDLPMAEAVWPLRGLRDRLLFFAGYLGLAACVGLVWWIAPDAALALFLAYSALHFSGDWREDGRIWRLAGGLSAIGAPAVFHPYEVGAVFAALGAVDWATSITRGLAAAGLAGLGCAIHAAAARPPRRRSAALELAAIWAGAAMLPPLLYFVAYFCLLHSLRHLTATLALLPDRTRALAGAAGIMAASLLGAAAALALAIGGKGADAESAMLGVVFIGLAALTVPHMLLVDRFAEASAGSDR